MPSASRRRSPGQQTPRSPTQHLPLGHVDPPETQFLYRLLPHARPPRRRIAHNATSSAPRPAAPGSSNAALHHRTHHAVAVTGALTHVSAMKRSELSMLPFIAIAALLYVVAVKTTKQKSAVV